MNKCSYCHEDRNKNIDYIKELCMKHELINEMINPGGRELIFKNKGKLQISDMCNSCDEKEILEFLNK